MAVAMSRAQIGVTARPRTRGCYLRIRHGKHISQPLPPGRPWAVQIAFSDVTDREAIAASFPTHEQAVKFAIGRLAELKGFAR